MYGGMTAGAWQYIGSQGILQGTYETFMAAGAQALRRHRSPGRFVLTAGLGGMGGAQPLAGVLAGAATLVVEVDPERVDRRLREGYLQHRSDDLDEALALVLGAKEQGRGDLGRPRRQHRRRHGRAARARHHARHRHRPDDDRPDPRLHPARHDARPRPTSCAAATATS